MTYWTIAGLAEAIRSKKLSPVEAVQGYLDRIGRLNPTLRSFITVDAEGALARARALEQTHPRGPLHGVLWQRLLGSQRLRMADYVRGSKATRGASVVGRGLMLTTLSASNIHRDVHAGPCQAIAIHKSCTELSFK